MKFVVQTFNQFLRVIAGILTNSSLLKIPYPAIEFAGGVPLDWNSESRMSELAEIAGWFVCPQAPDGSISSVDELYHKFIDAVQGKFGIAFKHSFTKNGTCLLKLAIAFSSHQITSSVLSLFLERCCADTRPFLMADLVLAGHSFGKYVRAQIGTWLASNPFEAFLVVEAASEPNPKKMRKDVQGQTAKERMRCLMQSAKDQLKNSR